MEVLSFKTRIINKHGTLEEWNQHLETVLLPGEVAIVEVLRDGPVPDGLHFEVDDFPATLIKVGDGSAPFKYLPWLSAKAGDVYQWAKAKAKPSYSTTEIKGFNEAVTGLITDNVTDTLFRLVQDKSRYEEERIIILKLQQTLKGTDSYTDVPNSSLELQMYDDEEVMERIKALELKVGSSTVATQITVQLDEAKKALQAEIDRKQDILQFADVEKGFNYTGGLDGKKAVTDGWVKNEIKVAKADLQTNIDTKQDILKWAGAEKNAYDPERNKAVAENLLRETVDALDGDFEEALNSAKKTLTQKIETDVRTAKESLTQKINTDVTSARNDLTTKINGDIQNTKETLRKEFSNTIRETRVELENRIEDSAGDTKAELRNELGATRTDLESTIANTADATKEMLRNEFNESTTILETLITSTVSGAEVRLRTEMEEAHRGLQNGCQAGLQEVRNILTEKIDSDVTNTETTLRSEFTAKLEEALREVDRLLAENASGTKTELTTKIQKDLETLREDLIREIVRVGQSGGLRFAGADDGYGYDGIFALAVTDAYVGKQVDDTKLELNQKIDALTISDMKASDSYVIFNCGDSAIES